MQQHMENRSIRGDLSVLPKSNVETRPVVTWDDYVHVLLMESGDVARAAIYLLQDGYPALAHTQSFVISPEQITSLVQGFQDSVNLRKEGITLAHDFYTLTRITDDRIMTGRNACTGYGCVIYHCKTCIIVGCYEEGNHPGGCYSRVTKLGDILVEHGF